MVDFNDNYISHAKMTTISNEKSGWNKKIQKPQLRGGVYHFKCNCDLTNGLQDDCRNPICRSSYTKLTKRTCSCGRSLLKKDSEETRQKEKNEVGDGDGASSSAAVKESKKTKDTEIKELKKKVSEVIIEKEAKKSEEKEVKAKESEETKIKEVKVKDSEDKENTKPKVKESKDSKKVKGKEFIEITKRKATRRI